MSFLEGLTINEGAAQQENPEAAGLVACVTSFVIGATALFFCGRRCLRNFAANSTIKTAAQNALPINTKIEWDDVYSRVTSENVKYKYLVGLRDEATKKVVAAFDLTVANSQSLTHFLQKDAQLVKATPAQRSKVTEFIIRIAEIDGGFSEKTVAEQVTTCFPSLNTISLIAPPNTLVMGALESFKDELFHKHIQVKYKVAREDILAQ